MSVLVLTMSDDGDCVDRVMNAIRQEGERAIRLDTDLFPVEVQLISAYGRGQRRAFLRTGAGTFDLSEVSAIWYRRLRTGKGIPKSLEQQVRDAAMDESEAALDGTLASLDAFRFDEPAAVYLARKKELQIQLADRLGLETPRTLATNDPREVLEFAESCGGDIVTKTLTSFSIVNEAGNEQVVYTSRVSADDLRTLEGLDLCPMTFQERIPKALELRATVVSREVFTASIDSQSHESGEIDWRRADDHLREQWRPYNLPEEIKDKLLRLLDLLGLNYGAIDLILTPDGDYVFLEVNPVGQYGWIETITGLPISKAIAESLLKPRKRRVAGPQLSAGGGGLEPSYSRTLTART